MTKIERKKSLYCILQNGNKYNPIKQQISEKAMLVDAYRLPENMFTTTTIGTDIIVFKKLAKPD